MRNVDINSISSAVKETFQCEDERIGYLLARLVDAVHDYARDTKLTHREWRAVVEFLTRAGEITDSERNEFVLLSDVLGLSSLVDLIHSPRGGTESSVLGPFHIGGSPSLPVGGDLIGSNAGDKVLVYGQVAAPQGEPIPGAVLEIWQTAANGLYSNQDPQQGEFNLRCRQVSDENGYYGFSTVRPAPYTVPDDGPVGDLLRATGRHPWRPSHLHFIVTAEGYRPLVTELFPEDDPYLDEDAVFGVRESLVLRYRQSDATAEFPIRFDVLARLEPPFHSVHFDFKLVPEVGRHPK